MKTFYRVEGKTGADFPSELEGVDLSTLTAILFVLLRDDGARIERPATIDDAAAGTFHVEWQPGDLVAGAQQLEIVVIDGSGGVDKIPEREPFAVIVRQDL